MPLPLLPHRCRYHHCRLLVACRFCRLISSSGGRFFQVLAELDRANANPNEEMDCTLLTGASKRYGTLELRRFLNVELDALMREQLLERERAMRYLKVVALLLLLASAAAACFCCCCLLLLLLLVFAAFFCRW